MKKYLIEFEKILSYGIIFIGLLLTGYVFGYAHSLYHLKPAYNVSRYKTEKDSADFHITKYYKEVEGFDFVDSVTVEKIK